MVAFTVSIPSAEMLGDINTVELLNAVGTAVARTMRERLRAGLDAAGQPFPNGWTFDNTGRFIRSIRADRVRKAKPGQRPIPAVSIGPRGNRPEARSSVTVSGGRGRGRGRGTKRGGTRVARNIDIAMFYRWRSRGTRVVLIGLRPADEVMVRDLIASRLRARITVRIT